VILHKNGIPSNIVVNDWGQSELRLGRVLDDDDAKRIPSYPNFFFLFTAVNAEYPSSFETMLSSDPCIGPTPRWKVEVTCLPLQHLLLSISPQIPQSRHHLKTC
jgi:hypothetical protein